MQSGFLRRFPQLPRQKFWIAAPSRIGASHTYLVLSLLGVIQLQRHQS